MSTQISDQVAGKTIRLSWTDGPTKGTTQEHIFHDDGTVEWHSVPDKTEAKARNGSPTERPHYSSARVDDNAWLISYLSKSGFTLTVVLNFSDESTVGIASNEKSWFPVRGRFEVVS